MKTTASVPATTRTAGYASFLSTRAFRSPICSICVVTRSRAATSVPDRSPTLTWLTITSLNVSGNLASAPLNVSPVSMPRRIASKKPAYLASDRSRASVSSALGSESPLSISVARFFRI